METLEKITGLYICMIKTANNGNDSYWHIIGMVELNCFGPPIASVPEEYSKIKWPA